MPYRLCPAALVALLSATGSFACNSDSSRLIVPSGDDAERGSLSPPEGQDPPPAPGPPAQGAGAEPEGPRTGTGAQPMGPLVPEESGALPPVERDDFAWSLTGTIAIEGLSTPTGGMLSFGESVLRDGKLYLTAGWNNEDFTESFPGVHLITVDTATDEVTLAPADTRCGFSYPSAALAANGDIYFFSDNVTAIGGLLSDSDMTECILRVNNGETTFDPTYRGSLSDAVGGRPVVGVGQASSTSYVAVMLDEDSPTYVPFETGDGYGEFVGNVAWKRVTIDFPGFTTSTSIEPTPYGRCCGSITRIGERSYTILNADNFATSTITEITDGVAVPGLQTLGIDTLQILRIR